MTAPAFARVRRTTGLLTACGALVAAGLSAAPEARAAASEGYWGLDVDINSYDNTTWSSCAVEGDQSGDEGELTAGTPETQTVDRAFTITSAGDETDTQDISVASSATWTLRDAAGGFRDLELTSSAAISGSAALGEESVCETYLYSDFYTESAGDAPADGFLVLEVDATGDMEVSLGFDQRSSGAGGSIGTGRSMVAKRRGAVGSLRAFVESGQFFVYAQQSIRGGLQVEDDVLVPLKRRAGADELASGTATASITFIEAGSASAQRGSGKRYTKLKQRSCEDDAVTAKFTGKAGKVKKVVFSVDGAKKKTVTKVKAGRSVSIKRLGARDDVTVEAVVTLKNGSTKTVERSYVACAG